MIFQIIDGAIVHFGHQPESATTLKEVKSTVADPMNQEH